MKIEKKDIKKILKKILKELEHGEGYERGETYLNYKGEDVTCGEFMNDNETYNDWYKGNDLLIEDLTRLINLKIK